MTKIKMPESGKRLNISGSRRNMLQLKELQNYSFSLVSILSFSITFLQNFVFAALLEKASFGKIFLITTFFSTFSYLTVFGLDTSIFKYFFDKKFEDKQMLRTHIFCTWALLATSITIVIIIIGYLIINYFHFDLLSFWSDYILLVISGTLFSFFLIFQQYFVASKQLAPYFFSAFGARLMIFIFNLGAIWFFGFTVNIFIRSYFVSTSLLFILGLFTMQIIDLKIGVSRKLIREILTFSTPLIFNGLISISFTNGYRILLSLVIPFGELAVFGIISQISSAYYIGLTSLVLPYNANAYQYLKNLDDNRAIVVPFYRTKLIQFGLVGFLGILVISYFLLKYFKAGLYFDGLWLLPILLVGQFIFLLYGHEHIILSFSNRTAKITYATLFGICVVLGSFYFLVSAFGLWGACIVSCAGYLFQYLAALYLKKKF